MHAETRIAQIGGMNEENGTDNKKAETIEEILFFVIYLSSKILKNQIITSSWYNNKHWEIGNIFKNERSND